MKKILLTATVMVVVIAMAGGAFAADLAPPPEVDVTATVQAKCTWIADGALTIAIDPAATGAQSMTPTQPQVKCTNKRTVTVTAQSAGKGGAAVSSPLTGALLKQTGFANIPYTFTFTPAPVGNGFGSGADVNFNIAGSVAETDAQAAEYSTANYTDTVTLTVAY